MRTILECRDSPGPKLIACPMLNVLDRKLSVGRWAHCGLNVGRNDWVLGT
jgi:hypothetical protein